MRSRFRLLGTDKAEHEWTFDVQVPRDSPFFDGHFPDRPVLPAIAQLAILTEVYGESLAPGLVIGSIPQLRFQKSIEPEQTVRFHVGHPAEDGRSAFAIRHEGQAMSRGAIIWRGGP